MHVYAHLHIDRKSLQRRLNVSSNIIDAQTYQYTYACIYIYIHIHICAHSAASVFADVCIDVKKYRVKYTPAHALVPRTPVPKCTQHSLRKNAQRYMHTHMCIRTDMHTNTHMYP